MAGIGRRRGDDALLAALAGGASIRQAAERASLSERTAHRRMRSPGFSERLARVRAELYAQAVARLTGASLKAAGRLEELLAAQSETVSLNTAKSVLELGTKLRDALELEDRIAKLEQHAQHPAN